MIASNFPDDSRIWLYASNRKLNATEISWINEAKTTFLSDWNTHGKALFAAIELIENQFIAIIVDDSKVPPSGCSIDKSVRFIKDISTNLEIDLFDRSNLFFEINAEIQPVHFKQISEVDKQSKVFDLLVSNLGSIRENWPIELSKSNYNTMLK